MPLLQRAGSAVVDLTWRIDAPRSRVWACLTHRDLLGQWLGEIVTGTVETGSQLVVDHGDGYRCSSNVLACAEPGSLELTWHFPDEPPSTVALELKEAPGPNGAAEATELRLRHRDLGELAESYRHGWCVHLTYLEASALGTPLPPAMFWRLHATVAQLVRC